jgi:hypothetical protein
VKHTWTALVVASLTVIGSPPVRAHATFVIHNLDAPGQGFNDTTPWVPVGGNNATTLGVARLNAVQAGASIWSSYLSTQVPIDVDARWSDTLTCTTTSGAVAASGATAVYQDFPHAPIAHTSYPSALANALAGEDLQPSQSDILITFNSLLGTAGCLPANTWYLGLDGNSPSNAVDLVTNVAHELTHGLGFQTYFSRTTGAKYANLDDVYLLNLDRYGATPSALTAMSDSQRVAACISEPNLLWTGLDVTAVAQQALTAGMNHGLVRMYGPNPVLAGSSVSHFSLALWPSQLMSPAYVGPNHDPGLAASLLKDVGWSQARLVAAPAVPPRGIGALGLAFALAATVIFMVRKQSAL